MVQPNMHIQLCKFSLAQQLLARVRGEGEIEPCAQPVMNLGPEFGFPPGFHVMAFTFSFLYLKGRKKHVCIVIFTNQVRKVLCCYLLQKSGEFLANIVSQDIYLLGNVPT